MPKILLLALGAAIALQPAPRHGDRNRQRENAGSAPRFVTVVDDPKPHEPARIEPEVPADSVPNSVLMPPMPAAPSATMCITPAGSCALGTSSAIGSSCACQIKKMRVYGSAQ
ncbi:MAG: hypothetical protein JOY64_02490 [Alphaproteobacteria bacterium]|nr:hypothetical protein [Alphaproteobacteria bacterium]